MNCDLRQGDCLDVLRTLESESVQCCITSPPYYGLRDYGTAQWEGGDGECDHKHPDQLRGSRPHYKQSTQNNGESARTIFRDTCGKCGSVRMDQQIGLEETPQQYVAKLVEVFEEVRRVLKKDGTCWVNLGDSYAGSGKGAGDYDLSEKQATNVRANYLTGQTARDNAVTRRSGDDRLFGYKPKDLMGIPWRVAFALQDAGWYLRQDIIWSKPNPMPEPVQDRCTKAHEYIFLLAKSQRYYFDQDAIREPLKGSSVARLSQDIESQDGSDRVPGKTNGKMKAVVFGGVNRCPDTRLQSGKEWTPKERDRSLPRNRNGITGSLDNYEGLTANKRSVWTVTTQPFKDAHFATFPPKLIEPMVLAGSRAGDTILDPFNGAGTTGLVALRHRRNYIGIELNPEYLDITRRRLREIQVSMFA
jgi:DNA modification methylase